ncbi:hypothetical protein PGTUg99_016448 [Puccinia graminis f. sp. tritici]|uniref:Uncharacterized protein n=1 Tax=Puccinia graminis f. sp. tritici TaxID=56615 RepID=A0A5B0PHM3_PUCGR|nr:hypothetical protein PGTUg99_016448 [Puccinia graminis f. sp. tritici]
MVTFEPTAPERPPSPLMRSSGRNKPSDRSPEETTSISSGPHLPESIPITHSESLHCLLLDALTARCAASPAETKKDLAGIGATSRGWPLQEHYVRLPDDEIGGDGGAGKYGVGSKGPLRCAKTEFMTAERIRITMRDM